MTMKSRRVCLMLLPPLCLVAATLAAGAGAAKRPSIDDMLQQRFLRVPGRASQNAALDPGAPGTWYDAYVSGMTMDFNGMRYRMWFVGATKASSPGVPYGYVVRIGLATSTDGMWWRIANDGKPVFGPGPAGSFDAKGIAHPYVLRVGGKYIKYMMWYGGISGETAQDLGLAPGHVRIERIGLATSTDGIHWKRENGGKPVMDLGPKGSIDSIQATGMHVLRIDGKFVMWYGAYGGSHSLGIATSDDGIHWTKGNNGKSLTGLRGREQLGPSVYFDGRKYLMLYQTNVKNQWTSFAATSDNGIDWAPAWDNKPVLGTPPKGNFDTAGPGRNHSVHPTKFIIAGKKVRLWYGGEDGSPPHFSRIGMMQLVLP
jgi:predicted GH43/DUF377 family glycosyl hydrolase